MTAVDGEIVGDGALAGGSGSGSFMGWWWDGHGFGSGTFAAWASGVGGYAGGWFGRPAAMLRVGYVS